MRNHMKTRLIWTVLTATLAIGVSGCVFDEAPTPVPVDSGKGDAGTLGDSSGCSADTCTGDSGGTSDATEWCPNGVMCDDFQVGTDVSIGACTTNADCGKSQLCAKPFGQCGGKGECKALPGTCAPQPPNGGQVCGCDGKNYADSCTAAYAGVNVQHTGMCSSAGTCTFTTNQSDNPCGPEQFCQAKCGTSGVCTNRPKICPASPTPIGGGVCGCDGVTYSDACAANKAGVDVASDKPCGSVATCQIGAQGQCSSGHACIGPAGQCSGTGTCQLTTLACTKEYTPVCGCDGKTYGNACTATIAGVTVAKSGACDTKEGCEIGKEGQCAEGYHCLGAEGQCSGTGTCQTGMTVKCSSAADPVCGCDGITYNNACMALVAGMTVAKKGECAASPTACNPMGMGPMGCGEGKYCATPAGQCTAMGECAKQPQGCTMQYDPVCGCDGKTYGNACSAASAGISVASKGECKPTAGQACKVGDATCGKGTYCAVAPGSCSGEGTCKAEPEVCDMMYAPVCGCDGKTYGSACSAAGAGVNIASSGECKTADLKWYLSCGGPICMGYKPQPGVPLCTDQKEGAACSTEGQTCDPKNECGQMLVCAKSDPKAQGCPKSRAALKTNIRYLEGQDTAALTNQLLATKLATYKYKAAGPNAPTHLGFLIDDQPDSPAVDSQRDMVDLYGYLSMSVAALQTQQRELQELRAELQALKAHCSPQPAALMCK